MNIKEKGENTINVTENYIALSRSLKMLENSKSIDELRPALRICIHNLMLYTDSICKEKGFSFSETKTNIQDMRAEEEKFARILAKLDNKKGE